MHFSYCWLLQFFNVCRWWLKQRNWNFHFNITLGWMDVSFLVWVDMNEKSVDFIMWRFFLEWEKRRQLDFFCYFSLFVQRTWSFLIFSCVIIQNVRMMTFIHKTKFGISLWGIHGPLDDKCPWRGLLLSHTELNYYFF